MPTDRPFRFFGVVHLPPLPGAPRPSAGWSSVVDRALADADALVRGGVDGLIIENLGDAPFTRGPVEPHVTACLAVIGDRIRLRHGEDLLVGLNVLRNDARAALGAAVAAQADFIRVNVLSGASWTDQGLIEGEAHRLLRYRRELGVDPHDASGRPVRIAADICVKHGVPAGEGDLARQAHDTAGRGGADALIVTGSATGRATATVDLERARRAAPQSPIWVGSGVTLDTAADMRVRADAAIVGTALHRDGDLEAPVEVARVRAMRAALGG